jgi:hypothetical protein
MLVLFLYASAAPTPLYRVGAMSSTLGAVLLDLRPRGGLAPLLSSNAPNAGLALGVLLTAVLGSRSPRSRPAPVCYSVDYQPITL